MKSCKNDLQLLKLYCRSVTKEQTLYFEAMKGCYNKAIQRKTRRQRLPLQQMSMPNTVTQDRGKPELLSEHSASPFSPSSLTLPLLCTSIVHSMCCIYKRPGPILGFAPVKALSLCTKISIPARSPSCLNYLHI